MGSSQERFGFAVGEREGYRSSVWTIVAGEGEAYVIYEVYGYAGKVSLHASGKSHWTTEPTLPWGGKPQRSRIKWESPLPTATIAAHVFRVMVPITQVRTIGPPRSKHKVLWVNGAPSGSTVVFDLYRTPPMADPASHPALPGRHLKSIALGDGGWIVTVFSMTRLDESIISDARNSALQYLTIKNVAPDSQMRGTAFLERKDGLRGMIEFALI